MYAAYNQVIFGVLFLRCLWNVIFFDSAVLAVYFHCLSRFSNTRSFPVFAASKGPATPAPPCLWQGRSPSGARDWSQTAEASKIIEASTLRGLPIDLNT